MSRLFSYLAILLFGAVLLCVMPDLPRFGDPQAPAAQHVSDHYIEHAYHDTHTPNIVTVMIADYRSFDTLGETVVVFAAGLACMLLLRPRRKTRHLPISARKDSLIVDVVVRCIIPALQIFALYVVFHGHYSPGGGFQGGALLAGSVLLARVALGQERSASVFPAHLGTPFGIAGIILFVLVGLGGLNDGGSFLQYDHLPMNLPPDTLRNWGILLVEVGVAFAVMGTLISIFDDLVSGTDATT